ncbi:hypothetical protein C2S53_016079 [Perilla frutescens var. hirtella]|uniref:WRKY domain-containing protein n=1 Tax=Perilla frutescens var. hirtella TaxID=608512 RepID=A0AAD4P578_PERFH|nr:hypothetical protein C2S53_016079 [Perilla frutescens var. hirtella]
MCSHLLKMMENYQGDLADVVRATTTGGSAAAADWQLPRNSTINYPSIPAEDFGDPFTYIRDPLIIPNTIDSAPLSSQLFYDSSIITNGGAGAANTSGINGGGGVTNLAHKVVVDHDEMKRPPNIFSRMLQISPNAKQLPHSQATAVAAAPPQRGLSASPMLVSNNCTDLQISSPRNTGIKRRKSQAKKVVCIPAPAPANSRSTGEIVPSDLWAWRKYGQKPIKGSPYPRGYYRCSSSKGCSARKQVERSRTDPNMLVITYTSEHNHPWPTQRNALAGSTRSQIAKNNNNNNNNNNGAKNSSSSPNSQTEKPTNDPKHEQKETSSTVKEEADDQDLELEFDQIYKPTLPDSSSNQEQDNFFADLGEIIGDDPLDLFQQGFSSHDDNHNDLDDPFNFYDWATAATTTAVADESNRHS